MEDIRKKVVVLGDSGVGKTSLLMVVCDDKFPVGYVRRVIDVFEASVEVENKLVQLSLWDTAGTNHRLRPLYYPDTDVIVMCFSMDKPDSLGCLLTRFVPEVEKFSPNVPIIMVANKKDLQDEHSVLEDAHAMASRIGAHEYLECSAKTEEGVREVFQAAARAPMPEPERERKHKRHIKCSLL